MRNILNRRKSRNPNQENLQKKWGSMIICDICTELISKPNKTFKNQKKCAHRICVNCMSKYIDAKLDSRMSRIKCPALNCVHYLDPLACRPIIPSLKFVKWCDLLCDSAVLKTNKCYCPHRECSVLILNECGGLRSTLGKSTCPKCKKLFCFSCQAVWHAGYSCQEFKEMREKDWHDAASGALAENNKWKRCPACHHCVERISGCNRVRCRCGASFCYGCGTGHCRCSLQIDLDPLYFCFPAIALSAVLIFIVSFSVFIILIWEN